VLPVRLLELVLEEGGAGSGMVPGALPVFMLPP
jgi:hypothetical protein